MHRHFTIGEHIAGAVAEQFDAARRPQLRQDALDRPTDKVLPTARLGGATQVVAGDGDDTVDELHGAEHDVAADRLVGEQQRAVLVQAAARRAETRADGGEVSRAPSTSTRRSISVFMT